VKINVTMVDPECPLYDKVDTEVKLVIGGLNINYKPQAVVNVCYFLGSTLGSQP
jgi:hypothetical protein